MFHSHICRREFTVPSLFPLFASNTDFMTSLSIFGNISSIWKNTPPTPPLIFFCKDELFYDKSLFYRSISSHNHHNITAESIVFRGQCIKLRISGFMDFVHHYEFQISIKLLGPSERVNFSDRGKLSKGPNWVDVSLPSPDGNRFCFRKIVFSNLELWTMDKLHQASHYDNITVPPMVETQIIHPIVWILYWLT